MTAEWIDGYLVQTITIADRELRLRARRNFASVTVEFLRPELPAVWVATVTGLGRRRYGYPTEPGLRSNVLHADWIGREDFDGTGKDVGEAIRKAAEALWLSLHRSAPSGYYDHSADEPTT